jgi:hypothetical protein
MSAPAGSFDRALGFLNLLILIFVLMACGGGNGGDSSNTSSPSDNQTRTVYILEEFNDGNLTSRGWVDSTGEVWIDTGTKYGGAASWRIQFGASATNCRNEAGNGTVVSVRKAFTASDNVYVSFYWRFNSDWVGSGLSYHPHLFFILDDVWTGLADGTLRVYIEVSELTARMIVGRGGTADWYDTTYEFSTDRWYKVDCWFKMNTVGSANGEMEMWVDGNSVYSNSSVTYRTSSSVHFAAFAAAPWISDGSPRAQTMWMDELELANLPPGG